MIVSLTMRSYDRSLYSKLQFFSRGCASDWGRVLRAVINQPRGRPAVSWIEVHVLGKSLVRDNTQFAGDTNLTQFHCQVC